MDNCGTTIYKLKELHIVQVYEATFNQDIWLCATLFPNIDDFVFVI